MALFRDETPEHLAETIICQPTVHVPNSRGWRKRVPKTHPSKGGKYWDFDNVVSRQYFANRKPALAVKPHGLRPVRPQVRPTNPTPYFTEREKMVGGLYGTEQYWADVTRIEGVRAELRQGFLAGQGAYTDGLKFKAKDDQLLAEIKACENKLRATQGIIQKSKEAAKAHYPTPRQAEHNKWKPIGANAGVAANFQKMGYKVRKIEAGPVKNHYYQVLFVR